jgi:hypothetical protein
MADEHASHCARATMGTFGPYRMPLADPVTDPESIAFLSDFPLEARRTARAAGLEPLLAAILREKHDHGEPTVRLLSLQSELSLRLAALESQLLAVSFEAHCTAGELEDIVGEIDRRERRRQFTLAVESLVVAAAGSTATGVWTVADPENTRGPAFIAIGAGLATATLSTLALVHRHEEVKLIHEHNLLEPVWRGIDPEHLYPSFVFRMLTMGTGTDQPPPRDALVRKWNAELDEASETPHEITVRTMYGFGGSYVRDLVELRQHQFESLLSALQGIGRDMELLDRFLVRKLVPPPPSVPSPTPLTPPPFP